MDESLKKIYKLWAKDRNRISDGELSLFIFNFNNYLKEYLQTDNKKKIFSSLKQSIISYLEFISDLSSKYPEIFNKLSKEIITIHTTLINPYNDQQLRRKTFKSAITIILNTLFFGKVKDWASFFHFYFYGLENQKLNIGTPEKATVNDILHDLDFLFNILSISKNIQSIYQLWFIILENFYYELRQSLLNASDSNIIADAITKNMYIEFTKGKITPLHIISFNSRALYESFLIILTSISNNSQISFQDQYIPVENLIFDCIIGNFTGKYISYQNEDKISDSSSVLATGFLEETQMTLEKYKYILSLTESENLPYELVSIYANLIPKFTPSSKQFKEIVLHLRMMIKCVVEVSNSSSILMKLISFINSCQNSYIIIPLCSLYLTLIADFHYMEELYLAQFHETVSNIITNKEDKRRLTALLNYFSIFYCVTFMRSIVSIDQFPNHIELANQNPVLFSLKYIIGNIDCMANLHSFNRDFPFLFISPNRRNKESSERFILSYIDRFNQMGDYLILPSFSRAFFQMANFIDYRIDCAFLSSHLLRRMIDHIKDGQCENRYYSLVASSDIMLSDMISYGISKQLALSFVHALIISTTDSDEEFFIKSFFIATKYFLDAKPFSFAIFHSLISNFVRLPNKAISHDIYFYADFIASCFHVIQSSSYQVPLNPYSSLIASTKMVISEFRGKDNIKVIDSLISQIFVSFFSSSEKQPFETELISIFEEYLIEIKKLPELPKTFLTIFPPFFNKVIEISEHLADSYISCLVSIGENDANFIFSCELLVDILFTIQANSEFMPRILSFFDHQFTQDRDRQKRNEEYAFFINNYKKKCANICFDPDQDFLLVRGGDPYLWFRRRNGVIQISSSNVTGSSKYCIDSDSSCKTLPFDSKCCKKRADLLNESWGILTPARPVGILVDMMNDFARKEFQVAADIELFAPSMKKIFSRTLKTNCKANILYVNSDKLDKAADVSKFSPDFISFLKSLGSVKYFDKNVEVVCEESPRTKFQFIHGSQSGSQFMIIWDDTPQGYSQVYSMWNQNKIEIYIRPLENNFFKVKMRAKNNYKNGPLLLWQIVSRRNLPFLLKYTVLQFYRAK